MARVQDSPGPADVQTAAEGENSPFFQHKLLFLGASLREYIREPAFVRSFPGSRAGPNRESVRWPGICASLYGKKKPANIAG